MPPSLLLLATLLDPAALGLASGAALLGAATVQAVRSLGTRCLKDRRVAAREAERQRQFGHRLEAALRWARASQPTFKAWAGVRWFRVSATVDESDDCRSFYLAPEDGRPLPRFEPGQYLTFHLPLGADGSALVRCYSLSERPREDYYRVTIKRVGAPADRRELPPGAGSSYFHRHARPGALLAAEAPQGAFFLDPTDPLPIVLAGAGIGMTPLVSMLSALVHAGDRREIRVFAGFRNGASQPLARELRALAAEAPNVQLDISYSQPRSADRFGRDYHHRGRAELSRLRTVLPANNYRYYLCGPPSMMETLAPALHAWGVPVAHIHYEAFGPATVRGLGEHSGGTRPCDIQFARSGATLRWQGTESSLLELAEQGGLRLDAGCRAGACGQCRVRVLAGTVHHAKQPGVHLAEGECLTCLATPEGDVALDV